MSTKNMFEKTSSQKLIILSFVVFFVLASAWLFFISAKYLNPNFNSDWWAVYFENPKGQDLNFTIENHSLKSDFHWEVTSEGSKLKEGDVQLLKGNTKNITIDSQAEAGQKIIIQVSANDEIKEIYKNF